MSETQGSMVQRRVLGVAFLFAGVAAGVWLSQVLVARGHEIDELGISGYSLPIDFVLGGIALLGIVGGSILIWRARDHS
ncbi:MAG: hypothetical protein KF680_07835 [Cryobacterium sp.]|nr:hypothetical protein [Cryobacterium sp.]